MSLCTSRGVGQYVASEAHTGLFSRDYKPSTKRPIVFFTGGPGDDRDFLTAAASGSHIPPVLAEAGFPLISAAFGGANLWGNATTVTRIGQAWAYVKTLLGTPTDKFIGIGVSKGFTALANYAKANPSNVAALVGIVPAVDIQDIDTNNRGGVSAAIQTAYGGAPPDASNPADQTATLAAIDQLLLYASDDATVISSTVTAYASATGDTPVNMGAVGHSAASANSATISTFCQVYA